MGIIEKISDKLHGDSSSSSKNVDNYDTTSNTSHQQANRLDERTGTSTASTTGTASNSQGNYGVMEPNSNSASTHQGHHGHTGTSTTTGTTSGRDTEVRQAAPVTQERVHDKHIHKDNLHKTDVHEKTNVDQTVQPVYDQETRGTSHETVQHGTEVREHGNRGIGREAEAELARNREQIGNEHRSTHDQETIHTRNHQHGGVETRQHNIEEVIPVVEKDVYRPHEIEHNKRVVDVHHEPTTVRTTHVNEPISASEFQRSDGYNSGTTGTTTHDAHSSSDAHSGKKKVGLGEKMEHMVEKVTHKDMDHDGDVAGKPKVGGTTTGTHMR